MATAQPARAAREGLADIARHVRTLSDRTGFALYRITLAKNLIAAGEVDEGAAHAVGSLEHLEEVESGRVTQRLAEAAGALGNVEAASAREAAGELAEYVQTRGAA